MRVPLDSVLVDVLLALTLFFVTEDTTGFNLNRLLAEFPSSPCFLFLEIESESAFSLLGVCGVFGVFGVVDTTGAKGKEGSAA